MTLLDISQSNYIFKQCVQLGIFGFLFCLALITYAFVCFRKGRKSCSEDTRKRENFKAIGLILFSLSIWFFGFMPPAKDSYELKQNGIETTGKTIEWVKVKSRNTYIKYSFVSNGHLYVDQCGFVYKGKKIQGIICPDGQYIVIYDKENPTNSIMDFKRERE